MYGGFERDIMKTQEELDRFIEMVREGLTSYYCKYCKRHIPKEKDCDLYIHDDVPHPDNYIPEAGGEHRLH
jgi:hypothetical protein